MAGVATQTPSFLLIILDTEMTLEAFDAEVNEIVIAFIFKWNFAGKKKVFVRIWVLSDPHNSEELFH